MHRQKKAKSAVVRGGRRAVPRLAIVIGLSALVWSLAACGEGGGAPEGGTASVKVTVGESGPLSTLAFKGTFDQVLSVRIEVYDGILSLPIPGGTLPVTSAFLQQDIVTGVWSGTVPNVPLGTTLTFVGRAYNVDAKPPNEALAIPANEIFNGSTIAALSETAKAINLALSPIDDGTGIFLPSISGIFLPAQVGVDNTVAIDIEVAGQPVETLTFLLTSGGGTFTSGTTVVDTNGNGSLNLDGKGNGTINVSYTAPSTPAAYIHSIEVTNSQGNSVTGTFQTDVVLDVASGDITTTFNPAITAISATRLGSLLKFTATVSDDKALPPILFDPFNLKALVIISSPYQWSFSPATVTTDFFGNGAKENPGVLSGYDETITGTVTLTVTDSDGGATTVSFTLPAGLFPDDVLNIFTDVALFANTAYVDYFPGNFGAEASNLEETLKLQGYSVSTFAGTTSSAIFAATDRRIALVIPELEKGDLNLAMSAIDRSAIDTFVDLFGGTLLVFKPDLRLLNLLNATFGFALVSGGSPTGPITLNSADASDTPFATGPTSLPALSATHTVSPFAKDPLPPGTRILYQDNGGRSVVTLIPFGAGQIVIMGWDWFNAFPVGTQDSGWLKVLSLAMLRQITLDAFARGRYSDSLTHQTGNTLTGRSGSNISNSYFIFDISNIRRKVLDAVLRLEIERYDGSDPSEALSIWDVSTDSTTLQTAAVGTLDIFNDLLSGLTYGSFTVLSTDVGSILEIPLNNEAVSDLNFKINDFAVGLHTDTIGNPDPTEFVRFSSLGEARTHQLVLTVR